MLYKYATAIKWSIYSVFLLLAITLQTTPTLVTLGGFRPVFVISLAVSVAMMEGELAGSIYGCAAGFVWDVAAGKLPGYSGFMLLILCFGCAIAVAIFIRVNYLSNLLLSGGVALLFGLTEFFFFYALYGYDNVELILLQKTLPQTVSSLIVAPIIFFVVKRVHRIGVQTDH